MTPFNNDVLINFVLDRSGSMASVVPGTIEGWNAFIDEQRNQPGKALLSLTLFDTEFETRYVAAPLATVPKMDRLGENRYDTRGGTALFDAVGTTIKGTEAWLANHLDFKGKVVCVILTDGEENSSRQWHVNIPMIAGDDKDVAGLIKWKQDEGWDFVFLGSGGSKWLERTFGHVASLDSFAGYDHSNVSNVASYAGVSANLSATRSTGKRFVAPKTP